VQNKLRRPFVGKTGCYFLLFLWDNNDNNNNNNNNNSNSENSGLFVSLVYRDELLALYTNLRVLKNVPLPL